jgi:single-strand DNA-binding protein
MATININRAVITGNLTADPELSSTHGGTSVCRLRVAYNTRRKNAAGEWESKANYIDVTVWGAQGESAARYLAKGRPVAIDGRLDWQEWEARDGSRRRATRIIADSVQFLPSGEARGDADGPDGTDGAAEDPGDQREPAPVGTEDDIPF